MPLRARALVTDAIKICAISFALLSFGEISLRAVYPEKVMEIAKERRRVEELAYRFHPDYGVELVPGVSKIFERSPANGGDVVEWHTNSAGFRGAELRSDPDTRIIVLGDSNIQARFSALEETFAGQLEQRLKALGGRDVEVVNGGIVGSGPDQSLLRLSAEIDEHDPDLIVFHVFADNDFGDVVRNRLFELDANGVLVRANQRVTLDENLQSKEPSLLLVKAIRKFLGLNGPDFDTSTPVEPMTSESRIQDLVDINEREFSDYESKGPRSHSHFADHYDIDVAMSPDGKAAREKVALLERILVEAKLVADTKGVGFLVLIQPSPRDLTRSLDLNYTHLQKDPDYRKDRLSSIVDQICSRHEIDRVNLFPLFDRNQPQHLYFSDDDDHWNDAGQALAARAAADFIYHQFLR